MVRVPGVYGLLLLAGWLLLASGPVGASFQPVADFDDLVLGPIHGQDGWTAEDTTSTVTLDPIGGANQVLSVITESTHLYRGALLPNAATRVLFLRFRYDSQLNFSLGMTDVAHPSRFDHFEVELSMTNSTNELRINDDGTYRVLALLVPETWYNCWILIDNASDLSEVWLHARGYDPADAGDQLDCEGQTAFHFRNGSTGDLVNFYIKTGGGSGQQGPLFLDDIYLEDTDGLNLSHPAMPTGSVVAGRIAGFLTLGSAQPNPCPGATTIRFTLDGPADIELAVFDVRGRRVADLLHRRLQPQTYQSAWDGRDASGRTVAEGVYFYRLRADDRILTRKLVLAR